MHFHEFASHLLVPIMLIFLAVIVHGAAMWIVLKYSLRRLSVMGGHPVFFARITLIFFVVLIMLAAHMGEMAVWSLAIYGLGLIPDLHTAYYYVTETYTTLGYRDAVLPQSLRSLTGWLATTGILMFAWSTAILTAVINRIPLRHETSTLNVGDLGFVRSGRGRSKSSSKAHFRQVIGLLRRGALVKSIPKTIIASSAFVRDISRSK